MGWPGQAGLFLINKFFFKQFLNYGANQTWLTHKQFYRGWAGLSRKITESNQATNFQPVKISST